MEFRNRLYELRKEKGLSQEELANHLDVTRQTIPKRGMGYGKQMIRLALQFAFDILKA